MEKKKGGKGGKGGKAKGKDKTQGVGSATLAEVEPEVVDLPSSSEAPSVVSDVDWSGEEEETMDAAAREPAAAASNQSQERAFAVGLAVPSGDDSEVKVPKGAASKAASKKPALRSSELKLVEKNLREQILAQDAKLAAQELVENQAAAGSASASTSIPTKVAVHAAAMKNFNEFSKTFSVSAREAEKLNSLACGIALELTQNMQRLTATGRMETEAAFQPNHFLCFCTCVHNRNESWKLAVPLQLAAALRFIQNVKFFVVTFDDDVELLEWACLRFQWAIDAGFLHLASGGAVGLAEKQVTLNTQARPRLGETAPVPIARFWHASLGKNSSHIFAMKHMQDQNVPTTDYLLCNLDRDNIFSPAYVSAVAKHWYIEKKILADAATAEGSPGSAGLYPIRAIVAASQHDGMTGRVCLQASDFARLGGYDQEEGVAGSGYQDVDLLRRSAKSVELHVNKSRIYPLRKNAKENKMQQNAGTCFPNKPGATPTQDRGILKIQNCDPQDIAKFRNSWGRFNSNNHQVMTAKLKAGRVGRNGAPQEPEFNRQPEQMLNHFMVLGLGCWFTRVTVGTVLAAPPPTQPAGSSSSWTQPASSSSRAEPSRVRSKTPPPPEPAKAPSQAARQAAKEQQEQRQRFSTTRKDCLTFDCALVLSAKC